MLLNDLHRRTRKYVPVQIATKLGQDELDVAVYLYWYLVTGYPILERYMRYKMLDFVQKNYWYEDLFLLISGGGGGGILNLRAL
jgi:hypothetical protein